MTGYKKVFLDTTPLIYFLDADVHFGEKTRLILEEILSHDAQLIISSITSMEYLVYPYRTENQDKIDAFHEFVEDVGIPVASIDEKIAERAAQIRAKYVGFKGMDSLQLATSIETNCDVFLTNDNQLKQIEEIACITVEDWKLERND